MASGLPLTAEQLEGSKLGVNEGLEGGEMLAMNISRGEWLEAALAGA
jgi:hypothetical protein